MSIKKTSILALSVLLSYESFAAPTVLATTPRLGASSSVASTGRGKATTSVSIGGGLNKLTSNRGQGSFTPNSAPTDKQNELIENFQKEIQNVRDAVAEELQAQNDKIKDLEEIIEEKDEKIAELEESIDEKIENSGFITAESVTSEISTAKQEAVRQATKAAVNEVNSMGFAKTAAVQSDILSAKNAAIAQAKTEAVAEVNGMGFAKTATIESDILTAKNAAIELATTAALAEVERKGFATNASVQNLKAEITTERNAALKSYATSAQLAAGIDAAKNDAITTANNAINTAIAAESAARSAIVEKLATKEDLQNLEVGVDATTLDGIINEKLQEGNFATVTDLDVLNEQVAQNTQNITTALSDITEEKGRIENLNARLDKDFVTSTALTTYQGEVAGTIATLATKDDLNAGNLEELLRGKFVKPTEFEGMLDSNDKFTAVRGDVDNLKKPENLEGLLNGKFVKPTELTDYATTESMNNRFSEIGDTIADKLLDDEDFKEGVLSGLSTELQELPGRVDNLEKPENLEVLLGNRFVKPTEFEGMLDSSDKFIAVQGDVTNLKKPEKLEELLGNKFVKPTEFEGMLDSSDKFIAVQGDVTNLQKPEKLEELLGNRFVKPSKFNEELTNSTTFKELDTRFVPSKDVKDEKGNYIFVKPTEFEGLLTDSTTFKELDTRFVPSKDVKDEKGNYTFVTQTDVKKIPSAVITEMQNSKSEYYIGNWTDSTGKNPLLVTQAELGTGVAKLFGETDETGLTKFKSTVTNLNDKAVTTDTFGSQLTANDTFKAAQAKVTSVEADLANKADSADVVTKTSLSNELGTLANNNQLPSSIVTTGNFAEKLTANNVVTQSSLGADLFTTLSAEPPSVNGVCSTDPNGNLKNLLIDVASGNAEFGTCTATPARPGPTSE